MPPDAYVAPAARVLTELHIPAPDDGCTLCGEPMLAEELWVPVEARDGDRVCPGCREPGRAAEDVQEALL